MTNIVAISHHRAAIIPLEDAHQSEQSDQVSEWKRAIKYVTGVHGVDNEQEFLSLTGSIFEKMRCAGHSKLCLPRS
jgi:hypothetical protein